jgi:Bacterial TSP3 repeat
MLRIDSSRRPASQRRRSDLRFAGIVSAGMIATVITLAVLLAPLLAWNGSRASDARERDQTIRLSTPGTHAPTPAVQSADRAAIAADAAGRLVATAPGLRAAAERHADGATPSLTDRVGVTERAPRSTLPRGAGPVATTSEDTDGDGLPDTWELRYGLNPDNAGDATADSDGDGLDNLTELRIRTRPNGTDSDNNGIKDGDEDSDGDGAVNLSEQQAGTDPGSSEDVPPVVETDDPGPAVIEDDTDVEDDAGSGDDVPAPPAPEHPDDGQADPQGPPVPAPEHPAPAVPAPEQPAPDNPAPGGDTTPAPPADAPSPSPAPATEPAPAPAPPADQPAASDPGPDHASPAPAAAPAPSDAAPAPAAAADDAGGWGVADQGGHGTRFAS